MTGQFQEHRFNVLKATELVYYQYRDWEFTYQSFISMVAYPLLQDVFYIDFGLELIGTLNSATFQLVRVFASLFMVHPL